MLPPPPSTLISHGEGVSATLAQRASRDSIAGLQGVFQKKRVFEQPIYRNLWQRRIIHRTYTEIPSSPPAYGSEVPKGLELLRPDYYTGSRLHILFAISIERAMPNGVPLCSQRLNDIKGSRPMKPLDQVRDAIRRKHYSIRTEESYVDWIRRFIIFHRKRHPKSMGEEEIRQYLSHLATHRNVAASTQNVALNAIVFLYKQVRCVESGDFGHIERAKKPKKLPVVIT
jgi:hypothetical protein